MSGKVILVVAGAAFLVSGCGRAEDDPANTPKLGIWNSKIELESVTLDGVRHDRYIPKEILEMVGKKVEFSELGCTEPRVTTVDDLNENLPSTVADMCKIKPVRSSGNRTSMESECDPARFPSGVTAIRFTGESEVTEKLVDLSFRVDVTSKDESGKSSNLGIVQKRSFWRIGECPA